MLPYSPEIGHTSVLVPASPRVGNHRLLLIQHFRAKVPDHKIQCSFVRPSNIREFRSTMVSILAKSVRYPDPVVPQTADGMFGFFPQCQGATGNAAAHRKCSSASYIPSEIYSPTHPLTYRFPSKDTMTVQWDCHQIMKYCLRCPEPIM